METKLEEISRRALELSTLAKGIPALGNLAGIKLEYAIDDRFWTLKKDINYYPHHDETYKEDERHFAMSELVDSHTVVGIIIGETRLFRDFYHDKRTIPLQARYATGSMSDFARFNNSSGPFVHEYKDTFRVVGEAIKAGIKEWNKVRNASIKRAKTDKENKKIELKRQLKRLS